MLLLFIIQGNDNVVVCKRYGQDTDISITHYYRSKADSELVKLQSEQDGLFKKHGRYYNGHIHCAFSRTKVSGFKNVNNLNKAHYLHVGTGNSGNCIDFYKYVNDKTMFN